MDVGVLYRGTLSPKQIAEGMNSAARNAARLVKDAEILFEAKRYPSAASLGILAIEEVGKSPILRGLSVIDDEQEARAVWKAYRDHQKKNILWLFPTLMRGGLRTLPQLTSLFDPNSKHTRKLDELKQFGFYTDCFGQAIWSEPDAFVDDVIAAFIIGTARSLTRERTVSEREIELWIEHVTPDSKPERVKRFWEAMVEEGLAQVDIDNVDEFLGIKPER
jgi:AbiV family abortive infection protein